MQGEVIGRGIEKREQKFIHRKEKFIFIPSDWTVLKQNIRHCSSTLRVAPSWHKTRP